MSYAEIYKKLAGETMALMAREGKTLARGPQTEGDGAGTSAKGGSEERVSPDRTAKRTRGGAGGGGVSCRVLVEKQTVQKNKTSALIAVFPSASWRKAMLPTDEKNTECT